MMDNVVEKSGAIMDAKQQRIKGTAKRLFPARGFFWISGSDGTDYFGHASQIQDDVDIYEVWVGQTCTFTPKANGPDGRGPFAEAIVMEVRR